VTRSSPTATGGFGRGDGAALRCIDYRCTIAHCPQTLRDSSPHTYNADGSKIWQLCVLCVLCELCVSVDADRFMAFIVLSRAEDKGTRSAEQRGGEVAPRRDHAIACVDMRV
jgi:hypothetical protein